MRIKAVITAKTENYTYDRYNKEVEILNELPVIGEEFNDDEVLAIEEVWLDSEFNTDEAHNYNYFEITARVKDEDGDYETSEIYAIKIDEEV